MEAVGKLITLLLASWHEAMDDDWDDGRFLLRRDKLLGANSCVCVRLEPQRQRTWTCSKTSREVKASVNQEFMSPFFFVSRYSDLLLPKRPCQPLWWSLRARRRRSLSEWWGWRGRKKTIDSSSWSSQKLLKFSCSGKESEPALLMQPVTYSGLRVVHQKAGSGRGRRRKLCMLRNFSLDKE
jgi:hypothetical protein